MLLKGYSVDDIVAKYNISARQVLRSWVLKYNANMELKDYDPKREVYMAEARRKTTLEERREILEYCIAHGNDYTHTAAYFDVSYTQVYSWVRKYKTQGEEGLTDKRGHRKTDEEVSELERLPRENARLKKQLEKMICWSNCSKSRRIRREVKLGRLKCEELYLTIQYFLQRKRLEYSLDVQQIRCYQSGLLQVAASPDSAS